MLNVPAAWRIKPSRKDISPWGAGDYGRALRIVLDDQTTPMSTARLLVERFMGHRGVEIYSTRRTSPWRVEIGDEPNANDALTVRYINPDGEWTGALYAGQGLVDYARNLHVEHGLPFDATTRVLRLEQAASHHGLDAVVTGLEIPNRQPRARAGLPLDLTSAESACWVLGLYLRAHNDFTVEIGPHVRRFIDSERFYRATATAAIDGGRWLTEADRAFKSGQPALRRLLGGIATRLARMLRMRDRYAVLLRHWRPDETWDESLAIFEAALLFLGGALDSAARYLDVRFEIDWKGPGFPSFRNSKWVEALANRAPDLTSVLGADGQLVSTASAVAGVRNLIHERAPSEALETYTDGKPNIVDHLPGVIVLDGGDAAKLSTAIAHMSEPEEWGLKTTYDGTLTVLPFVLMPRLVRSVLESLRQLVRGTAPSDESGPPPPVSNLALDLKYGPTLLLLGGLGYMQPELGEANPEPPALLAASS